ncbi:MAG: OmpA family protein [Candidatus Binataceae bacterium]
MVSVHATTLQEKFWLKQVDSLGPEKSVERLDSYGKYLLGTASAVGTILTGFGIFSSPGSVQRSRLLLIPIVLACVSLALAGMGITPRVERVNPANPDSIRDYYSSLIRNRGRCITFAGWLFALSLACAGVVLVWERGRVPPLSPKVTLTWTQGEPKSDLNVNVKFENVPRSALIETKVFGTIPDSVKSVRVSLFQDFSRPDFDGKVEVSGKLTTLTLSTYGSVTLMLNVTAASKSLYRDAIEIPLPRQPAALHEKLVLPSIHFESNDATIHRAETAALDHAVASLKTRPPLVIRVDGYCDAKGRDEYNLKLSRRRTEAVVDYLEKRGIPKTKLVPVGYGKTNFVASNDTDNGRARNRRVDLSALGCN